MKTLTIRSLLLCVVLLTFVSVAAASQHADAGDSTLSSRSYYGTIDRIDFEQDSLTYSYPGQEPEKHSYRLIFDSKVPFIELSGERDDRWLALYNEQLIFLYDAENAQPFFRGAVEPRVIEGHHFLPEQFSASSYLIEGEILYLPRNLGDPATRRPWVENAPGNGLGEEILFQSPIQRFWISVGFVSYSRPELYTLNSRPKTLRIFGSDAEGFIVRLKDTPNPQLVTLPAATDTVRVVIEDVYVGTRWQDTVVNFILFF